MVVKPLVGGVRDSFLFCLSLDVRRVVIIVPSVTDLIFFLFPSLTAGVYFCTCFVFLLVFKMWVCNT